MHAIGAPDATASLELLVNPEGQEINTEVEVQQAGLEEPEEEIECPTRAYIVRERQAPEHLKSPTLFSKSLLDYVIPA